MNVKKTNLIALAVAASALLWGAVAHSQDVGKITFQQESEQKYPAEQLNYNMQLKPGDKFDGKILNQDIKRLYESGYFSDVVSETSTTPDGKVDIVIKVKPKPKIKSVEIRGNRKFEKEKLQPELTVVADTPLSDKKLKESAEKLRKVYYSKGYNDARITPKLEDAGNGEMNVVFDIKENLRVKVNNVSFEGNTVYSSWDLKNSVATQHSYFSWMIDIGLLSKDEFANDKLRLRELYWNKGYLDFKVLDVVAVEDPKDPEYADVTFKLFEGEPYTIGTVSIKGNDEFSEEELLPSVKLVGGQLYDNRLERTSVDAITDVYHAQGYADFACRVSRVPEYEKHTVNVEFQLTEGVVYEVKDVHIIGNKVTKDKVIRRELAIQPGDPVDQNRIDASKSRLMGMGYFEDVETASINSGEQGKKNVNFNVKEKSTAHFKVGGGFSDTDSLVGMVELSQTNFDLLSPENYFQGGGQRVKLQTFVGLKRYDFNVSFTEPWLLDLPYKYDLQGYLNNVQYDHWEERRLGVRTGLSRKIFDDFTTASAGYKFEQVKVHKMDDWLPDEMMSWKGNHYAAGGIVGLGRDTRDSLTDPTNGYMVNLTGEIDPKALGSSYDYYRLEAKAGQYANWEFWEKRKLIFFGGSKLGTVSSFNRSDKAPLYERYFLGGVDTIRGFPWREVSPTETSSGGDVVNSGGQSMLVVTGEVNHPIYDFIRGAFFVDAGNAYNNSFSYNFNQINVGAGWGIRVKLPYLNAPVQVDLAYPIINKQDNVSSKLRVHFNMGFTW